MKYVHYGHCKFIKGLFTPIQNRAFWMKPIGGLWGSMPDGILMSRHAARGNYSKIKFKN